MGEDSLVTSSKVLAQHYRSACFAEIEALKPGNVHLFADGHGMQVQDFIKSAEASAELIAKPELSLGERIYQSVDATWQAVGCNTNLGIILLCAPIVQAALKGKPSDMQSQLKLVVEQATLEDADWVFKAIRRANPGGLGRSEQHDVNNSADCTLLEAMQLSAGRDLIALQYSNGFSTTLNEGLPCYEQALQRIGNAAWAVTELYLYWLSHYPDSHIVRKYGVDIAQQVLVESSEHYAVLRQQVNPRQYASELLKFDQSLKVRGINPGTSADLTVSTLFAHMCLNMDMLI